MEWMILPLKRYAQFGGRSRRKEYWLFFLFTIIASAVLGVIDAALGLELGRSSGSATGFGRSNGVLGSVFSLATLVPSVAVGVRRLHDTDRSGWWLLMPLAAIVAALVVMGVSGGFSTSNMAGLGVGLAAVVLAAVGSGIVLLVFFCLDGTRGPNRFGADPKSGDLADVFA